MKIRFKQLPIVALFIITGATVLSAYSDPEWDPVVYSGYFFVLMEPSGPFDPDIYDEDSAVKQLLEEARYVFSSIIYGFDFEYIPKDSARNVDEEFSVEPVFSIKWGDPGMSVEAGEYKNGKYTAEISYKVSEAQIPWVTSWETNILPEVSAMGTGNLYSGFEGKKEAMDNSVKEAVRAYLRARVYDKPKRISGRARFASVPYITIDSGLFQCMSKVTLQIEEVLEYRTY